MSRAIKPTTKEQKRVIRLSSTLPDIDVWSEDEIGTDVSELMCNVEDAYCYNSSYYCDGVYYNNAWRDHCYCAIVTTCKEFQVIRYLHLDYTFGGTMWSPYQRLAFSEVAERWINKDTLATYLLAQDKWRKELEYWSYHSPLKLRKDDEEYNIQVYAIKVIKADKVLINNPSLVDKYLNCDNYNWIDNSYKIGRASISHMGEWLSKLHPTLWKSICKYQSYQLPRMLEHEKQIRKAMRKGFRFSYKNIGTWLDYVNMLERNKATCANQAYYLAPQDLHHAHDWMVRVENKRKAEEKRLEALKHQKQWEECFSLLKDIRFDDGTFFLHSMQSIAEYQEEGKAMHHCVGGYYKQKNSLILSCRDAEGNRLSTIEVNLSTMTISQDRGLCNAVPEHKEKIDTLINKNMHIIKEAYHKQIQQLKMAI